MKYGKPPLSFDQQAELVLKRGLIADRDRLTSCLKTVNYYRLSGYWYPFKNDDDTFKDGTTLETVWQRYRFDRQLRVHTMDAVERVEIAIRSQITNIFSIKYGPLGYLDGRNFPNITALDHKNFLDRLKIEVSRSRERYVSHFFRKYGDIHRDLPLWMAVELIPFGMTLTMFRALDDSIKKEVALSYGVLDPVMESWLRALNATRNICAHHGRLWNRELGYKPIVPRKNKHPEWHFPTSPPNNRVYIIVLILKHLMDVIVPQSGWAKRIESLFVAFPQIPLQPMGFPENWKESPIWINEKPPMNTDGHR